MVYSFSSELRKIFYGDFLMKKYFFRFFLHWDGKVRNDFQQLIIFRMIKTRRSLLQKEGFSIGELGTGYKSPLPYTKSNPNLSADYAIDQLLFGKIETYLHMVSDQLRSTHSDYYPKTWEVYVPKSLSEYKIYLSRYFQLESDGEEFPSRPVSLSLLQPPPSKPITLTPISPKPSHKTTMD